MTSRRTVYLALLGLLAALCLPLLPLAAQGAASAWGAPANVSSSGAASQPLLARSTEGELNAVWWDRFDGVTISRYVEGRWAEPQVAPIRAPRLEDGAVVVDRETGAAIIDTLRTSPNLTADAQGGLHALWLGPAHSETGLRPLIYSVLRLGTTTWSLGRTLQSAATAWRLTAGPDGTLHLVYFDPSRGATYNPGIYYQRSTDGGATWSGDALIAEAQFVRLASPGEAHLDLLVGDEGALYVAWDDPRTGRSFFSRSQDGGAGWEPPAPVGGDEAQASRARFASSGGALLQLWQVGQAGAGLRLYQRISWDGGDAWSAPQRILPDVAFSLDEITWRSLPDGRLLALIGGRAAPPALALWDPVMAREAGATGWSLLDLTAEGQWAGLPAIKAWRADLAGDTLTVAAVGEDGDVWTLRRRLATVNWVFPAPVAVPVAAPAVLRASGDWLEATPLGETVHSTLALVGAPDGRQRAFWWAGEALRSALYDGQGWGAAASTSPEEALLEMPTFVGDGRGHALAFWLAAPAEGEAADALWFSAMPIAGDAWSAPVALGDGVLTWAWCADPLGGVHLAYARAAEAPATVEIIYRHSADAATWAEPAQAATLDAAAWGQAGQTALSVAADGAGHVAAAWQGASSLGLATSADGGATWGEAITFDDPEMRPRQPLLLATGAGEFLLLWEPADSLAAAGVYQQRSADGGLTWEAPQRVAERPLLTEDGAAVLRAADGQPLLAAQDGAGRVAVRAWLGAQAVEGAGGWSQPRTLEFSFVEPGSERVLLLSEGHLAVAGDALGAVGLDAEGRLWALRLALDELSFAGAPASPWQEPARLEEEMPLTGLPALAADGQGQLHALWSESGALLYARYDGARWSRPAAVLRSPEGAASQPSLAVMGDRLYAAWCGGAQGLVYGSSAFLRDAYAAGSWAEPSPLPAPPDALDLQSPRIVAGLDGALHVVYTVPLNEGRGVYYTRSADGGATWSEAARVFDAVAAGWLLVAEPALAVDADGALYVAWVRGGLPIPSPSLGVYLSYSHDGGRSWSAPLTLREGAYVAPTLALSQPGVAHALWRDAAPSGAWWQRTSADGGLTWSPATQVRGARGLNGQAAVLGDWNGALYLLGVGLSAERNVAPGAAPTLVQLTWQDALGRWESAEPLPLGRVALGDEGLAAALAPLQGRLAALVRVDFPGEEALTPGWLYAERMLEAVAALPAAPAPRDPAPTPAPTPPPTPTPRPMIDVTAPTPAQLGQALDLGLVRIPYLMLGGLLAVVLILAAVLVALRARR